MKRTQPLLNPPALALPAETFERSRPLVANERLVGALVLLIALAQGLLYLALVPPWQHYDEPTHFEYAWLIANLDHLPAPGDADLAMRRDVAASMLEHDFFRDPRNVNSLKGDQNPWIGLSELQHPATYYVLVSMPLRFVRHLDIVSQLYVARAVSLLLFVLTIAIVAAMMRDLTPPGHVLRWAVPLATALLPSFVDLMTGVNNDAGVTVVFTLFLWRAIRAIHDRLTWPRLIWIVGSALLAAGVKNTGAVAIVLAVLAVLIAMWRQRRWRWRWLVASIAGLVVVGLLGSVGWGDAADWYRESDVVAQARATRVASDVAPVGPHALMLETRGDTLSSMLLGPLLPEDIQRLGGRTITLGGWVWADRPATVSAPALSYKAVRMPRATPVTRPVTVTTTPTFIAWTFVVPEQTNYLSYMVAASTPATGDPPLRLFLDGALIVEGAYSTNQPPVFDNATARGGIWDGRRFANLMRNPAFESSWPRVRPWVDQALIKYIHRTPAQLLTTLIDLQRIKSALLPAMLRPAVAGLVSGFAWGQVRLSSPLWLYCLYVIGFLAICGCVRWLVAARISTANGLYPAIVFLMLSGMIVWGNTMLRPLPLLGEQYVLPATRYTFPAIAVTALVLVGGSWALWPQKQRVYAVAALLIGLLILNLASIGTIWSFYYTVPG
jgi:hypothetical protein